MSMPDVSLGRQGCSGGEGKGIVGVPPAPARSRACAALGKGPFLRVAQGLGRLPLLELEAS